MRFYPAHTLFDVMRMPASAFFVLNEEITRLQAEEEAVALVTHHSSEPQKRLDELMYRIRGVKSGPSTKEYVLKPLAGEASYEKEPGEIAAFRERQKQAAEQIKQDRQAWLQRLKEQQAQKNTPEGTE